MVQDGHRGRRAGTLVPIVHADDATAIPLPPGVTFRPAGTAIETVGTKAGALHLLSVGHGTEIIEGTLHKGERMSFVPAPETGWEATENYYVLEGVLELHGSDGYLRARPGDCLTVERLTEAAVLTALEPVRFLYITTQPTFHEISRKLGGLMELAVEIEVQDGYTADHCRRLQTLAYATGTELRLPSPTLRLLDYGAYLHDVGKVRVPRQILCKPGKLTDIEWDEMRKHPTYGREMLEDTFMAPAGAIVEQHHERLDGSGYPLGLQGDEVTVEAAIVGVADTYDAMTSDRVYRKAPGKEVAVAELKRLRNVTFQAEVVDAFLSIVDRIDPPVALADETSDSDVRARQDVQPA